MKILCALSHYAYGNPERGENYDYVNFLPALRGLGHEIDFFDTGDRTRYRDFADLNAALLARVMEFRPDIMFCVLMHYEIWSDTLDLIRSKSPVLIVNWGTDDSWKFRQASRFFAEHVDLHVTTDFAAADHAPTLGLPNVFLSQWAGSAETIAEPYPSQECRYDVSFVGSMYGDRAECIAALRGNGVAVSCFGHGTEGGIVNASDIPRIYRDSRISLNFSGSSQSTGNGHQIKARTFEVPCAGGFLLTEATPGLDRYFAIDHEIATFKSKDELINKVRYFLDNPEERDRIALAGYRRTAADHTYKTRFSEILARVGALRPARVTQPWALSTEILTSAIDRYRRGPLTKWSRAALIGSSKLIFGQERGPRAARRLAYELSWRLTGAATYRAAGLPGRLFYAES